MALSLRGLAKPVARAAAFALASARAEGIPVTVTSTRRSRKKQQQLYAAAQAGQSRYPAAPPGLSAHEYGMAFDSWVPASYVPRWVAIRRAVGFQVPDNDLIHAQVPGWEQYVRKR